VNENEEIGKPNPDNSEHLLRMRAEARALLEDPNRLPVLWAEAVSVGRDNEGNFIGPPVCEARHATVKIVGYPDRDYMRLDGESIERFKARITSELPVRDERPELWSCNGGPGLGFICVNLRVLDQ